MHAVHAVHAVVTVLFCFLFDVHRRNYLENEREREREKERETKRGRIEKSLVIDVSIQIKSNQFSNAGKFRNR